HGWRRPAQALGFPQARITLPVWPQAGTQLELSAQAQGGAEPGRPATGGGGGELEEGELVADPRGVGGAGGGLGGQAALDAQDRAVGLGQGRVDPGQPGRVEGGRGGGGGG